MKAASTTLKDARIDLRVNLSQKALLEQAAAAQGIKLSEFVIGASTEAAALALADQRKFVLPEDQMEKFLASIEEEPTPLPALKALFDRPSVFE